MSTVFFVVIFTVTHCIAFILGIFMSSGITGPRPPKDKGSYPVKRVSDIKNRHKTLEEPPINLSTYP